MRSSMLLGIVIFQTCDEGRALQFRVYFCASETTTLQKKWAIDTNY